jgi:prepilin-type processing-associated H-X9-DG protein
VLAELCNMLVNRRLLKIKIQKEEFSKEEIEKQIQLASKHYAISEEEVKYFVFNNNIENNAYNPEMDRINILFQDGSVKDITEASDNLNIQALSMTIRKYFLCYPSISG